MHWSESGIVLSARKHGESSAIVNLLTPSHGRHVGLVRGGTGKRLRGVLQPGNEVTAAWRARLSEHLGNYTLELDVARAAHLLDDRAPLAALSSACAMAEALLPEREPHPAVYAGFRVLLDALGADSTWPAVYVYWELGLLAELGFGLDLKRCAATGAREDLVYVSPRSGRAVSRGAGAQYADRLLALPTFLLENGGRSGAVGPSGDDIMDGLALTGHFLELHVLSPHGGRMPAARGRLLDRIGRDIPTSSGILTE